MKAGDVFLLSNMNGDTCLTVVLTDPNAEKNVYTARIEPLNSCWEMLCVLEPEDHPALDCTSVVVYEQVRIISCDRLVKYKQNDPARYYSFSEELMKRVYAGAQLSAKMSKRARKVLIGQCKIKETKQ